MDLRIEKWTDRVHRDGLVEFAIGYLRERGVGQPVSNRFGAVANMTPRAQLGEMVAEVLRSENGELRFRWLQDAVRQKRAALVRGREKRSIKRLDLRNSACAKLESLSRASRLSQSTLVENLITDEAALRRSESVSLKSQRQKINEDAKRRRQEEAELKARDAALMSKEVELSRREEAFSQGLARLAAFDTLLNAIMECEAEDLDVRITIDPEGSVKNSFAFSPAEGASESVKPVVDAWAEVLGQIGGGSDLS